MCGTIGIFSHKPVAQEIYDGLIHLQHRGQDAAGILTYNDRFHIKKGEGLVRDIFHAGNMQRLIGNCGLGHTRYPTAGSKSSAENAQPLLLNFPYGIAMAHNGDLTNYYELQEELRKKEWQLIFLASLLLGVIVVATFLFGGLRARPDQSFTGITLLTAGDINVYYSYIQQVLQGHWLLKDLYTIEPQARLFFNPFFLSFGLMAKVSGLSPVWVLFLTKLLLIPFGILVIYLLTRIFFNDWFGCFLSF